MFEKRIDPAFDVVNVDDPNVSSLRNQLDAWCKHIASAAIKMRDLGNQSALVDDFFLEALEASAKTKPADPKALTFLCLKADYIFQLVEYLGTESAPAYQKDTEKQIKDALSAVAVDDATVDEFAAQGAALSAENRRAQLGDSAFGLHETIVAALQGAATLTRAARVFAATSRKRREYEAQAIRERIKELRARIKKDKEQRDVMTAQAEKIEAEVDSWKAKERAAIEGIVDALAFLATDSTNLSELGDVLQKVGTCAANAFEVYELGAKYVYGVPEPVGVRTTPLSGTCAIFSGDNFDNLQTFLDRAEFSDVNVWTRGDAIAAHALPAFKKYRRLVGHYGGSRCDQNKELGAFPGSILVASGPFDEPSGDFADYVLSTDLTRWDQIRVVERKASGDLSYDAVVKAAVDSGGFGKNRTIEKIPVGFAGDQLPSLVDKAARAYRSGALKRVFALGGEDVPETEKDYFAKLFDVMPETAIALAFGDVKFRFNRKPTCPTSFGSPKIVDLGRTIDMNAAFRFAAALNKELDKTAETSPVSFFLSVWGEKSLAGVLAACALGYRNVVVGPYRPSVWTDEVVDVLREKLGLRLVGDPEADAVAVVGA